MPTFLQGLAGVWSLVWAGGPENQDVSLYKNHKFEAHKKKFRKPKMIDTFALAKCPAETATQLFTAVLIGFLSAFLQMDDEEVKIQFSGFAAYFIPITPLAQAALADNQNTATITVKTKSNIGAFLFSL